MSEVKEFEVIERALDGASIELSYDRPSVMFCVYTDILDAIKEVYEIADSIEGGYYVIKLHSGGKITLY